MLAYAAGANRRVHKQYSHLKSNQEKRTLCVRKSNAGRVLRVPRVLSLLHLVCASGARRRCVGGTAVVSTSTKPTDLNACGLQCEGWRQPLKHACSCVSHPTFYTTNLAVSLDLSESEAVRQ